MEWFPKNVKPKKTISGTIKLFSAALFETESESIKTTITTRSQEAIKNVTTNAVGVAQATNPLITVATYVALFLTVLPIGLFGFVQVIRAQPGTNKAVLETEEPTIELTAAERRAQRKAAREAREAKTETVAVEPEVTVEVVNTGFNGFDTQNADFGTMQTPFAGGFGMMPPPFGGFPGFGAMPMTDANGFNGFGTTPNADENTFGAGFGNF